MQLPARAMSCTKLGERRAVWCTCVVVKNRPYFALLNESCIFGVTYHVTLQLVRCPCTQWAGDATEDQTPGFSSRKAAIRGRQNYEHAASRSLKKLL